MFFLLYLFFCPCICSCLDFDVIFVYVNNCVDFVRWLCVVRLWGRWCLVLAIIVTGHGVSGGDSDKYFGDVGNVGRNVIATVTEIRGTDVSVGMITTVILVTWVDGE